MQTIIYILPELFLSISIMTLLILGVFIKGSFKIINVLTLLSLVFGIILVLNQPQLVIKIFNESYIIDELSIFMKVLTLLFCLFILSASRDYLKKTNTDKPETLFEKGFALALNTITSPKDIKITIGGIKESLYLDIISLPNNLLKQIPSFLEIIKLIKACTSR